MPTMDCRSNGVSDQWCVGPMVCWNIGVSDQWCVGLMVCRTNDMLYFSKGIIIILRDSSMINIHRSIYAGHAYRLL